MKQEAAALIDGNHQLVIHLAESVITPSSSALIDCLVLAFIGCWAITSEDKDH
jgi:hypothetical protein